MRRNIIKRGSMSLAFEKTARISLGCKLIPVQYREWSLGCCLATNVTCKYQTTNQKNIRAMSAVCTDGFPDDSLAQERNERAWRQMSGFSDYTCHVINNEFSFKLLLDMCHQV